MSRLLEEYKTTIIEDLKDKLSVNNIHQVPKISKIVINMGIGDAKDDTKLTDKAQRDLKLINRALENGAYSAAVQAEYRRGQAQGNIYINKSEIRHGSIDSMSKDEAEDDVSPGSAAHTAESTRQEDSSSSR